MEIFWIHHWLRLHHLSSGDIDVLLTDACSSFFFFFLRGGGGCRAACGILVPQQGIEPRPQQWDLAVLDHQEIPDACSLKSSVWRKEGKEERREVGRGGRERLSKGNALARSLNTGGPTCGCAIFILANILRQFELNFHYWRVYIKRQIPHFSIRMLKRGNPKSTFLGSNHGLKPLRMGHVPWGSPTVSSAQSLQAACVHHHVYVKLFYFLAMPLKEQERANSKGHVSRKMTVNPFPWENHKVLTGFIFFNIYLFSCTRSRLRRLGSSSLTRDQTWVPCFGSSESQPLDHLGSPLIGF